MTGRTHHIGRPGRNCRMAVGTTQRCWHVINRKHGRCVKRTHRKVRYRVAAGAISTLRYARMVRILSRRRPVNHAHARPAHAGLMAALTATGNARVRHLRASPGLKISRRVTRFAGPDSGKVRRGFAWCLSAVMAARAIACYTGVRERRGLPGQQR